MTGENDSDEILTDHRLRSWERQQVENSDVTQRLHDPPVTELNASNQSAICAGTIYKQSAQTDSEKTR
jgi:hypothetical protein